MVREGRMKLLIESVILQCRSSSRNSSALENSAGALNFSVAPLSAAKKDKVFETFRHISFLVKLEIAALHFHFKQIIVGCLETLWTGSGALRPSAGMHALYSGISHQLFESLR